MNSDSSKQYKIFVTGVGAIIGYGIIESLRSTQKNLQITGCDIYIENYGRYLCDNFVKAAPAAAPDYILWLNDVIDEYKIDLVIPGIEQDLFAINSDRDNIKSTVAINNSNIIELGKDKLATIQFLKAKTNLPYIKTIEDRDFEMCREVLGIPFIVKPRFSYASKGFNIIYNKDDFRKYVLDSSFGKLIFQKYIGNIDEEYTVSVFGDGNGNYLDCIVLRRYLSKEGATNKAYVIKQDESIEKYIQVLVKELKPIGPTNFQFRKEDGVPYLLEVNPRISSTCSIRTKFGYNDPLYCLNFFIEQSSLEIPQKKYGKVLRFINDYVVYEQECGNNI